MKCCFYIIQVYLGGLSTKETIREKWLELYLFITKIDDRWIKNHLLHSRKGCDMTNGLAQYRPVTWKLLSFFCFTVDVLYNTLPNYRVLMISTADSLCCLLWEQPLLKNSTCYGSFQVSSNDNILVLNIYKLSYFLEVNLIKPSLLI